LGSGNIDLFVVSSIVSAGHINPAKAVFFQPRQVDSKVFSQPPSWWATPHSARLTQHSECPAIIVPSRITHGLNRQI
jgi:hypothetical protein